MSSRRSNKLSGFTLIELVVGIVLMAVALTLLTSVFFANPGRSVEPLLQIRAAEFGQALMDEILSKKFDELTPDGGVPACTACSAIMGAEGAARDFYNDVDDYNESCGNPIVITDALNNQFDQVGQYAGYSMEVCVFYDGDFDGNDNGGNTNAKLITVNIYLPSGAGLDFPISFTAYKGNY
ncbi:prepilin-type N-terminal cleavage/methylation domain-containing protein [Oceanicoccus sp. KOV_DT_Chl]|uniref:type IV pilus modification PilV family protein n=1 Tax=Oceanicoccus sp. KOV_DT_Chl TaxID=1904639 RepID=UPI0011AF394E|nr:prepilin-type N-terminal cleavage/methylation domain-containing protein [Oceanicoccus sp. KOV_DT_Chl]